MGAVQGGGEAIGNKIVELSGVTDNPEFQKFAMENPNLGKYLVDAINIAGMFVGGKKGIEEGVKPAGASGEGIISTLAKPIEKGLEKTYDVGTNIATKGTKFGISQATGLNPETLSTAFRDPYGLGEAQKTHYGRMDLAQEVKTKADQAIKDFSDTGKQYDIVRKGNSEVVFPEDIVTKTLNKYGIDIKDGKLVMTAESKPLSPGDVSAIQNFYNQYGNKTNLSGNAFMNAREALSNMSGYDVTTSKALKPLAREMRHAYDTIGKTQLPGLKDLDAIYGPKAQSIKLLKKDLLTKEGELKDSSISKLANIQGKGKEKLQLRMEGLLPGVSQKAARLKAIEDIQGTSGQKVGAYSRSLLTGGRL